jgi:SET domain-containing protein
MSFVTDHLEVKDSLIADAGKGLFATIDIKKGDYIDEYKGEILTEKELEDRDDHRYVFQLSRNHLIDAIKPDSCMVRYMNDPIHSEFKANAKFFGDRHRKRVIVRAIKNISKGEEILAPYGRTYWKTKKPVNKRVTKNSRNKPYK